MTPSRDRRRKPRFGRRSSVLPLSNSSDLPHSTRDDSSEHPPTSLTDNGFSSSNTMVKLRHTNRRLCQKLNERGADMRSLREENIKLQRELLNKCEEMAIINAQFKLKDSRLDAMAALLVDCITQYRQLGTHLYTVHTEISALAEQTQSKRNSMLSNDRCSSPPLLTELDRIGVRQRPPHPGKSSGSDSDSLAVSGDKRYAAKRRKLHRVLPSISGCVISRPSIVLSRIGSEQQTRNAPLMSPICVDPVCTGNEQLAAGTNINYSPVNRSTVTLTASPTQSLAADTSTVSLTTSSHSPTVVIGTLSTAATSKTSRQLSNTRRSNSTSACDTSAVASSIDFCDGMVGASLSPFLTRLPASALCPRDVRILVSDCASAGDAAAHDDPGTAAAMVNQPRRDSAHKRRAAKLQQINTAKNQRVETIDVTARARGNDIDVASIGCFGDSTGSERVTSPVAVQETNGEDNASALHEQVVNAEVSGPCAVNGNACEIQQDSHVQNPAVVVCSPDVNLSSTAGEAVEPNDVGIDETVICRRGAQCDPSLQTNHIQLLLNSTVDTTLGVAEPPANLTESRLLNTSIAENSPRMTESRSDASSTHLSSSSSTKKRKVKSKSIEVVSNDVGGVANTEVGVVETNGGVANADLGVVEGDGGVTNELTSLEMNGDSPAKTDETTIIERHVVRDDTRLHREVGLRLMNETLDTTLVQLTNLPSLTTMKEELATGRISGGGSAEEAAASESGELLSPTRPRSRSSSTSSLPGSAEYNDEAMSDLSETHDGSNDEAIKHIISRLESEDESEKAGDEQAVEASAKSTSPSISSHSHTPSDADNANSTAANTIRDEDEPQSSASLSNSWLYRLDPLEGPSHKVWTDEEVREREIQRQSSRNEYCTATPESDWKLSARPTVVIRRMSMFDRCDKPEFKSHNGRNAPSTATVAEGKVKARPYSSRSRIKCVTLE